MVSDVKNVFVQFHWLAVKNSPKNVFFFSQKSVLHNSVRFPDWKKWIAKNAQKLQLFILFEKNVQKGVWNKSIKGFANELR